MSKYELNRLMYDLRLPECREAINTELVGYLKRYDLSAREQQLIANRDWQGLVEAGASVYVLTKLIAAFGVNFLAMGAAMRGMSKEEFSVFLEAQNTRLAPYSVVWKEEEEA